MTKRMEKALATIERRINNYMAMQDKNYGIERAYTEYSNFDTMLDAMFMNDMINDKEYVEATDELMRIRKRTLWA